MSVRRAKMPAPVSGILAELPNPGATGKEIELCEMSIVSLGLMAQDRPHRVLRGLP
jgi:hypothetical protein